MGQLRKIAVVVCVVLLTISIAGAQLDSGDEDYGPITLHGVLNGCSAITLLLLLGWPLGLLHNLCRILWYRVRYREPLQKQKQHSSWQIWPREFNAWIATMPLGLSLFFSVSIVHAALWEFWHVEEIGHFYESRGYVAHYYVNLFPQDKGPLNYRAAADIYSTVLEEEGRVYILLRARFPGGKVVSFPQAFDHDKAEIDDDQLYHDSLRLGEKVEVKDDTGREWYVELTPDKADIPPRRFVPPPFSR